MWYHRPCYRLVTCGADALSLHFPLFTSSPLALFLARRRCYRATCFAPPPPKSIFMLNAVLSKLEADAAQSATREGRTSIKGLNYSSIPGQLVVVFCSASVHLREMTTLTFFRLPRCDRAPMWRAFMFKAIWGILRLSKRITDEWGWKFRLLAPLKKTKKWWQERYCFCHNFSFGSLDCFKWLCFLDVWVLVYLQLFVCSYGRF